ncbi:Sua5/YciO/YrdC/YwlC family protein [Lewinella sp. JB7]|uniref:Sua5/YciO/YrdC/YwlC family protein n=1 Tax=Lewinella sp. JB7 TaxID=2962887 RepID=UPI0020C95EF6|nr:Sua5/YciO/YrdC/YwlC family protein [Lewinella sp. JB7]MCP9235416.1 Sua5/YciO/YrdC/YwlC family protein [Lewinella sp. JB7]
MLHRLPHRGVGALSTIKGGGLVLLPTANLWQVVTDARQLKSVNRLVGVCPPSRLNCPELIFADREMLLSWFPRLHPKIDTLLSFHGRVLTVKVPATVSVPEIMVDRREEVAVRLALDSFCYRLTEDLEAPLAACLAMNDVQAGLPTRFGKIRSDVLRQADFTVQRRQRDQLDTRAAVAIRLQDDEIEFL